MALPEAQTQNGLEERSGGAHPSLPVLSSLPGYGQGSSDFR
jgi:hypothetical protein